MEQGQNLSIFEADKLVGQTLSQLRPVYRQALIDLYGGDHRLIISDPNGQHLNGLQLCDIDEKMALEVLWVFSEISLSREADDLSLEADRRRESQQAVALPFILYALLYVERFCDFHLDYFRYMLEHEDDFQDLGASLRCRPRDQRKVVISAMRLALLCYSNYAMGDGVGDCMSNGADDRVRDLMAYIL